MKYFIPCLCIIIIGFLFGRLVGTLEEDRNYYKHEYQQCIIRQMPVINLEELK